MTNTNKIEVSELIGKRLEWAQKQLELSVHRDDKSYFEGIIDGLQLLHQDLHIESNLDYDNLA